MLEDFFKLKRGETIHDKKRRARLEITQLEKRFMKAQLMRIWPSILAICGAIAWVITR